MYQPRLIDVLLSELMAEVPAVSLIGPRASGKTTTARQHATTAISLDTPGVAEVFRTDPDAALRGLAEPVLLDEWPESTQVLGAVKRAIDADPRPGRYILTGSVRAEVQPPGDGGSGSLVSKASLQADLANAQERNTRLAARITQLEKRLSEFPGEQAWRESGLGAPEDIDHLKRKITELEQQVLQLTGQLEERTDDLDAARAANRELIARLNTGPRR